MERALERLKALLERVSADPRGANVFDEILHLHRDAPSQLAPLMLELLLRATRTLAHLDAGLSLISEGELAEIAARAVDLLAVSAGNEAAVSCVSVAALQAPLALRSHLRRLFEHHTRGEASPTWWRGAGPDDVAFLGDVALDMSRNQEAREFAWRCLLEAGSDAALRHAIDRVPPLPHDAALYFQEVGLELLDGSARPLVPEACFHIRFADEYIAALEAPAWWPKQIAPAWTLPADEGLPCTVGGVGPGACTACEQPLHRVVSLPSLPGGLGVRSVERLELVTCLSCLGWEIPVLFFRHEPDGAVRALYDGPKRTPQFPNGPLQQTHAHLAPTPPRWRRQDWGASNGRESLHRVGGHPTWIQSPQYPECPSCAKAMPFLLQLDSNLTTDDGGEWMWGSGGIGYFFWCDACQISAGLWQCT